MRSRYEKLLQRLEHSPTVSTQGAPLGRTDSPNAIHA